MNTHTFILHLPGNKRKEVTALGAEDRAHALHLLIVEHYEYFMDAEKIVYKEPKSQTK